MHKFYFVDYLRKLLLLYIETALKIVYAERFNNYETRSLTRILTERTDLSGVECGDDIVRETPQRRSQYAVLLAVNDRHAPHSKLDNRSASGSK